MSSPDENEKRKELEKREREWCEFILINAYKTTHEYLLDRAEMYSMNNKRKLMQARAQRRNRLLATVDEEQASAVDASSAEIAEAGPSGVSSRSSSVFLEKRSASEEMVSTSEIRDNASDNMERTAPSRQFSPVTPPSSPEYEQTSFAPYLSPNVPMLSILSIAEPTQNISNHPSINIEDGSILTEYAAVAPTPRPMDLTTLYDIRKPPDNMPANSIYKPCPPTPFVPVHPNNNNIDNSLPSNFISEPTSQSKSAQIQQHNVALSATQDDTCHCSTQNTSASALNPNSHRESRIQIHSIQVLGRNNRDCSTQTQSNDDSMLRSVLEFGSRGVTNKHSQTQQRNFALQTHSPGATNQHIQTKQRSPALQAFSPGATNQHIQTQQRSSALQALPPGATNQHIQTQQRSSALQALPLGAINQHIQTQQRSFALQALPSETTNKYRHIQPRSSAFQALPQGATKRHNETPQYSSELQTFSPGAPNQHRQTQHHSSALQALPPGAEIQYNNIPQRNYQDNSAVRVRVIRPGPTTQYAQTPQRIAPCDNQSPKQRSQFPVTTNQYGCAPQQPSHIDASAFHRSGITNQYGLTPQRYHHDTGVSAFQAVPTSGATNRYCDNSQRNYHSDSASQAVHPLGAGNQHGHASQPTCHMDTSEQVYQPGTTKQYGHALQRSYHTETAVLRALPPGNVSGQPNQHRVLHPNLERQRPMVYDTGQPNQQSQWYSNISRPVPNYPEPRQQSQQNQWNPNIDESMQTAPEQSRTNQFGMQMPMRTRMGESASVTFVPRELNLREYRHSASDRVMVIQEPVHSGPVNQLITTSMGRCLEHAESTVFAPGQYQQQSHGLTSIGQAMPIIPEPVMLPPPLLPPVVVCRYCNKGFKSPTGLKMHLRKMCERHLYPPGYPDW